VRCCICGPCSAPVNGFFLFWKVEAKESKQKQNKNGIRVSKRVSIILILWVEMVQVTRKHSFPDNVKGSV
jgi:hypothetical protein